MRQSLLALFAMFVALCAAAQSDSIDTNDPNAELPEVVVKAYKPLTKVDGDGIIVTIANTPLQSLASANELLGYLPGVTNNNGSIEVVGRGQPTVYINGRKLVDNSELSQISAAKVKDVKIIRNPGARYGGSTQAVIRITTVRELGEGFSMENHATVGTKKYAYGNGRVNANYRNNGLDIFGAVNYDQSHDKMSSHMNENIWGVHHQQSLIDMDAHFRTKCYDEKIGFNYSSEDGHSFGAFYQNTYQPAKSSRSNLSATFLDEALLSEEHILSHSRSKLYSHLIDGYYSGKWGKWNAEIACNLLWRRSKSFQHLYSPITEPPTGGVDFGDSNRGRMFAGEIHLSRPITNGSFSFGAEYTNTSRTDDFKSNYDIISSNNDEIKEYNISAYCQMVQTFGRVTLQAGLRYEHTDNNYYEFGQRMPNQSRIYNELLPSAYVVMPIRNTTIQFSYARRCLRPVYAQLSNTISYLNQYTYETGNPNLRSVFTDNLSLNVIYKWLTVMATYKHKDKPIITECTQYDNDPDVTLLRKANSSSMNELELILYAQPGFISNFYYPIVMVGIVSQHYKIDYMDGIRHMNNPLALIRLNNMLRLPNGYMVNVNYSYKSDFDGENVHMHSTHQLDVSASKTINSHWEIRCAVNDIFNTARRSHFLIYSGMQDVEIAKFNTMRCVELTIGYKFNVAKSKYKGKGAGHSEKNRL